MSDRPMTRDELRQAALAQARSAARLAELMVRLLDDEGECVRSLSLVPEPCAAASYAAVIFGPLYWYWCRVYHCACQWHLAIEVHPLFHVSWCAAVGASVTWKLWDYAWKGSASTSPRHLPRLPGSRAA